MRPRVGALAAAQRREKDAGGSGAEAAGRPPATGRRPRMAAGARGRPSARAAPRPAATYRGPHNAGGGPERVGHEVTWPRLPSVVSAAAAAAGGRRCTGPTSLVEAAGPGPVEAPRTRLCAQGERLNGGQFAGRRAGGAMERRCGAGQATAGIGGRAPGPLAFPAHIQGIAAAAWRDRRIAMSMYSSQKALKMPATIRRSAASSSRRLMLSSMLSSEPLGVLFILRHGPHGAIPHLAIRHL